MQRFAFAIVGATLLAPEAKGQEFTSPRDVLTPCMKWWFGETTLFGTDPFFSDSLSARMSGGSLGQEQFARLGFNPMIGVTKGELITSFDIDTNHSSPTKATAIASFNAGDVPVTITFNLVREDQHGWQIDALRGMAGDVSWDTADWVDATKAQR
jgi:hypothetical protein